MRLVSDTQNKNNFELIEKICVWVKEELKKQGLTSLDCDFLESHGEEIMSRIKDEKIRSLPVLFG